MEQFNKLKFTIMKKLSFRLQKNILYKTVCLDLCPYRKDNTMIGSQTCYECHQLVAIDYEDLFVKCIAYEVNETQQYFSRLKTLHQNNETDILNRLNLLSYETKPNQS